MASYLRLQEPKINLLKILRTENPSLQVGPHVFCLPVNRSGSKAKSLFLNDLDGESKKYPPPLVVIGINFKVNRLSQLFHCWKNIC